MQELSLYCLVPNARHTQVLRIFSGICNMNPEPQFIHHLIYKPRRRAAQAEMYHLQLISKIDEKEWERRQKEQDSRQSEQGKGKFKGAGEEDDVDMIGIEADDETIKEKDGAEDTDGRNRNEGGRRLGMEEKLYDIRRQKWIMRFLDFPETMRTRPVTTRVMYLAEVGDGDALAFMEDLGYT